MNTNMARKIAEEFISSMNPENWNGIGIRPDSFNTKIATYDINSKNENELDISFDYCEDEGEWEHYCELRDKLSGDLITPMHGYGVNDVQNLMDTIECVCEGE